MLYNGIIAIVYPILAKLGFSKLKALILRRVAQGVARQKTGVVEVIFL
jgi:hypothetical protein